MMNSQGADFIKCKDCAFGFLNKRRHTKKELTEKLVKKEYDISVSREVADYLEEAGYIDDLDYARRFIHDAVKIKKYGTVRIKKDLYNKGVNGDVIDKAFEESEVDTDTVLSDLIEVKASNMDLKDEKQLNRLYGFLLRRGFNYGEIKEALRCFAIKKENC